jgi:DNA-binding response OmpR family regulator
MKKIKVMIVDDELDFATTLQERLEIRNFEVVVAVCAGAALTLVRNYKPQVVLLDLKMPDMSGLDVLSEIKAFDSSIEVILLTGHGGEVEKQKGMERGAFDYILKPVEFKELMTKINQAAQQYDTAHAVA